jgi:hypothetical protein
MHAIAKPLGVSRATPRHLNISAGELDGGQAASQHGVLIKTVSQAAVCVDIQPSAGDVSAG